MNKLCKFVIMLFNEDKDLSQSNNCPALLRWMMVDGGKEQEMAKLGGFPVVTAKMLSQVAVR